MNSTTGNTDAARDEIRTVRAALPHDTPGPPRGRHEATRMLSVRVPVSIFDDVKRRIYEYIKFMRKT